MKYIGYLFGDGRGKLGGNVFSRNRYGSYIRGWVKPVNPSSARQQIVRSIFQTLTELWNGTLTEAQRAAWNLYGNSVVVKDSTGGDIRLTGFSHYIRSNVPILQVGGTRVDDGPTTFSLPEADWTFSVVVDEATQKMTVTFDNALDWAIVVGGHLAVTMSQPRGEGREFIGGPYRYAGVVDGAVVPPTSPASIDVPFAVAEGQKVECSARILGADGRVSEPFRQTSSVVA